MVCIAAVALGAGETAAGEGTDVVAISDRAAEGLLSCGALSPLQPASSTAASTRVAGASKRPPKPIGPATANRRGPNHDAARG